MLTEEIEANLFNGTEATFVNFIVTKREVQKVNKTKIMGLPSDIFETIDDTLETEVTNVQYTEAAAIPDTLAVKLQNEVLKYYKKKHREITKQLKEA